MKRVLEARANWTGLPEQVPTSLFDFKWAPVSRLINFEMLNFGHKNMVNHLEFHGALTTKDQIYLNMHRYCEINKLDVFQYLPIQFTIDFSSMSFTHEIDKFCGYYKMIEKHNRKHATAD